MTSLRSAQRVNLTSRSQWELQADRSPTPSCLTPPADQPYAPEACANAFRLQALHIDHSPPCWEHAKVSVGVPSTTPGNPGSSHYPLRGVPSLADATVTHRRRMPSAMASPSSLCFPHGIETTTFSDRSGLGPFVIELDYTRDVAPR